MSFESLLSSLDLDDGDIILICHPTPSLLQTRQSLRQVLLRQCVQATTNSVWDTVGIVLRSPEDGTTMLAHQSGTAGVKLEPLEHILLSSSSSATGESDDDDDDDGGDADSTGAAAAAAGGALISVRKLALPYGQSPSPAMREKLHATVAELQGRPPELRLYQVLKFLIRNRHGNMQETEKLRKLERETSGQISQIKEVLEGRRMTKFQHQTLKAELTWLELKQGRLEKRLKHLHRHDDDDDDATNNSTNNSTSQDHNRPSIFEFMSHLTDEGDEDLTHIFSGELVAKCYQRMGLLPEYPAAQTYRPLDFSTDNVHRPFSLLLGASLQKERFLVGNRESSTVSKNAVSVAIRSLLREKEEEVLGPKKKRMQEFLQKFLPPQKGKRTAAAAHDDNDSADDADGGGGDEMSFLRRLGHWWGWDSGNNNDDMGHHNNNNNNNNVETSLDDENTPTTSAQGALQHKQQQHVENTPHQKEILLMNALRKSRPFSTVPISTLRDVFVPLFTRVTLQPGERLLHQSQPHHHRQSLDRMFVVDQGTLTAFSPSTGVNNSSSSTIGTNDDDHQPHDTSVLRSTLLPKSMFGAASLLVTSLATMTVECQHNINNNVDHRQEHGTTTTTTTTIMSSSSSSSSSSHIQQPCTLWCLTRDDFWTALHENNIISKNKETAGEVSISSIGDAWDMIPPTDIINKITNHFLFAKLSKTEDATKGATSTAAKHPHPASAPHQQSVVQSRVNPVVDAFFPVYFSPGENIFGQDDPGNNLYFIEKGMVELRMQHPNQTTSTRIGTRGRGESFGELALLFDTPRSASAWAAAAAAAAEGAGDGEDVITKLWAIDRDTFNQLHTVTGFDREAQIHLRRLFEHHASVMTEDGTAFMTTKDFIASLGFDDDDDHDDSSTTSSMRSSQKSKSSTATTSKHARRRQIEILTKLADINSSSLISFIDFCALDALMCKPPFEALCEITFLLLDLDKNGHIDVNEFRTLMPAMLSEEEAHKVTSPAVLTSLFGVDLSTPLTLTEFQTFVASPLFPASLKRDIEQVSSSWGGGGISGFHIHPHAHAHGGAGFDGDDSHLAAQYSGREKGFDEDTHRNKMSRIQAGVLAAVVSRSLVAPLDRLKILMQAAASTSAVEIASKSKAPSTTKRVLGRIMKRGGGGQISNSTSVGSAVRVPANATTAGAVTTLKYRGILQSMTTLIKEEGPRSLFRGNLANVARIGPFTLCHMFVFDRVLKLRQRQQYSIEEEEGSVSDVVDEVVDYPPPSALDVAVAGAIAGGCATMVSYPFDLMRARLAVDGNVFLTGGGNNNNNNKYGYKYGYRGSMSLGFKKIVTTEGLSGLYRGLGTSIIGVSIVSSLNFGLCYTLLPFMPRSHDGHGTPSVLGILFSGVIAARVSQLLAFPLDTIRRGQQLHTDSTTGGGGGLAVARRIGSIRRCFAGVMPSLAKIVPSVTASFVVSELAVRAFRKPQEEEEDG